MASRFDIIIVGGGMVGLAMAASLAETGLAIAVLEKSDFKSLSGGDYLSTKPKLATNYDVRVSAISPGNQSQLSNWQVWSKIPEQRLAHYQFMRVWDAQGSGEIEFDAAEIGQPWLGTIVENQALRAAIYQRLLASGNVQMLSNITLQAIRADEEFVHLDCQDRQVFTAKLLIGADGALSSVRRKLMINSAQTPYQQQAFVANVRTELPHQATAWQRFTPLGPVAFLPLPEPNLCSIVWSIDEVKAKGLKNLNPSEFASKLTAAFEHRLGKVQLVSEFAAFPLIKRHSESYLSHRCALVGDAAHTIHPLAGQGVNLGFQDVTCLSDLIIRLNARHRDIGLVANLRPFERERKLENHLMQNAMSGFKWMFGHRTMPVTLLRNFALNAVDKQADIKNLIIKHAMGI